METKSQIAADYDQWAETYDTDHNRTRDLAAEILRKADLNLVGRKVIEVGCGTGRNTEWLSQSPARFANLVALDFSDAMLTRARARVKDSRVRFIQHDARAPWPFTDAYADVVIAMLILEHVEHLEPFFVEAARTLKPHGELFICELHPERQLAGKQAQFISVKTGERHLVTAFLHQIDDYLKAAAGFAPVQQADWHDEDALPEELPRLLSLLFRRQSF
jgi:ubiquinone/menaquinone biosynthesis C-methylase UbiE